MSVLQDATLAGVGTLGGTVSVAGIHSPGDGVGTQTIDGPLDYQNTARIDWEITSQSLTADKVDAVNVTAAPGAVVRNR